MNNNTGISGYYLWRGNSFITNTSFKVRKRIYDLFFQLFGDVSSILDVGVTSETVSPEANVLETLFPYKNRITAAGIEDMENLKERYPGIRFVKIEEGRPLPFGDNSFGAAYSHAVIEHITEPNARRRFVSELVRVAKCAFISTPNKYFILEPHTLVPFLHFLWPKLFYFLLDGKIVSKFYNSANLKLMSRRDLECLAAGLSGVEAEVKEVRLFGMVSNLILIIRKK